MKKKQTIKKIFYLILIYFIFQAKKEKKIW